MSDLKPLYPSSYRISGAIYAGVPHCSMIGSLWFSTVREMPKSHSLMFPFSSIKILSSLMSLWRTDLQWQWAIAYTICRNIGIASFSVRALFRLTSCNRSPPDAYSNTMYKCWLDSNTSRSLIICLWRIADISATSQRIFSICPGCRFNFSIILMATDLPVNLCYARATFPKAPLPTMDCTL